MGLLSFCRKKSPWLLHFNTGSCLPGEVELILGDGRMIRIDKLVESHLSGKDANPHAFADVAEKILSWDGYSAEIRPVIRVHKLKAAQELVEITPASGIPVKMTLDHKVLVDGSSGPEWVEARNLRVGDYLYSPRTIRLQESPLPEIIDCLPDHYIVHLDNITSEKIRCGLKENFESLNEAARILNVSRSRMSKGKFTIEELQRICRFLHMDWQAVKQKVKQISGKNFVYKIPKKKLDKNLMRLLGLVASDGSISVKKGAGYASYKISFSNIESSLIEDFVQLYRGWSTTKKVSVYREKSGVMAAAVYDPVLAHVAKQLGFKGVKGEVDLRPIFRLPETHIRSFLGGYFDGDGHVGMHREGDRMRIEIGFTTNKFDRAKMIHLLLKRVGIGSCIRHKKNRSSFGTRTLYQVLIKNPTDIRSFIQRVPFKHAKKLSRAKIVLKLLKQRRKIQSIFECAPLMCNKLVKKVRKAYGLRQSEIHRWPAFISMIENGKRIQKQTLVNILKQLEHLADPKDENLQKIRAYVSEEYYLDPIKDIKRLPANSKWVYNLTVDGTHSFIPEGTFVVKNCNGCDIELLAALSPRYDLERFGIQLRGSPRHADILVVTGPVTRQTKDRLLRIYEQMPEPKTVIAVGSCPISGCAFYDSYNVLGPLNKFINVDAYVPGCPPKPEAIIFGILKALQKV